MSLFSLLRVSNVRVLQRFHLRCKSDSSDWGVYDFLNRLKLPKTFIHDLFVSEKTPLQEKFKSKDETSQFVSDTKEFLYTSSGKTVASIQSRARTLLTLLKKSSNDQSRLKRLEELIGHMNKYPVTRTLLKRSDGISVLLCIREETQDKDVKEHTHMALSILGWTDSVRGNGIRVLALDGGGTR